MYEPIPDTKQAVEQWLDANLYALQGDSDGGGSFRRMQRELLLPTDLLHDILDDIASDIRKAR